MRSVMTQYNNATAIWETIIQIPTGVSHIRVLAVRQAHTKGFWVFLHQPNPKMANWHSNCLFWFSWKTKKNIWPNELIVIVTWWKDALLISKTADWPSGTTTQTISMQTSIPGNIFKTTSNKLIKGFRRSWGLQRASQRTPSRFESVQRTHFNRFFQGLCKMRKNKDNNNIDRRGESVLSMPGASGRDKILIKIWQHQPPLASVWL